MAKPKQESDQKRQAKKFLGIVEDMAAVISTEVAKCNEHNKHKDCFFTELSELVCEKYGEVGNYTVQLLLYGFTMFLYCQGKLDETTQSVMIQEQAENLKHLKTLTRPAEGNA